MLHHRNHSEELNIALQLNLLFILRKNILLKFFSFFLLFFLQRVLKNLLIFQIFFLKNSQVFLLAHTSLMGSHSFLCCN